MTNPMRLAALDQPIPLTQDMFEQAARDRWPNGNVFRKKSLQGQTFVRASVREPADWLEMTHTGLAVSVESSPTVVADIICWLRSLLPEDVQPPLVMEDLAYTQIRDIPYGITPDQVWDPTAWREP